MTRIILLVFLSEILTALGQVLFKKSANSLGVYSLKDTAALMRLLKDVLARPAIWAGLAAMALGLMVWLMALAEGELSIVFSLGSMQYIIILFAAHFLLGEKIDRMKCIGTLLVMFGIILITLT